MHEGGDSSRANQDLRDQEQGLLVKLMSKRHGGVDNDVPPRDEGCEVIKGVIVVHGVRKNDGKEVEPDQDHGDPVEAILAFLVVWDGQRFAAS